MTSLTIEPLFFAILGAITWSLNLIIYKALISRGASPLGLMIIGQTGAAIIIGVSLLRLSDIALLSTQSSILILTAGVLWAAGIWLEMKALEQIDAGDLAILGVSKYLFITLIGILAFNESLATIRIIGILILILGIFLPSDFNNLGFKRGFWYAFLGMIFQSLAYSIDKERSQHTSVAIITFGGFFLPAIVSLGMCKQRMKTFVHELTVSKGLVVLVPCLLALNWYLIIKSFSIGGELIAVSAIIESSAILTCILSIIFLNERDRVPIKLVGGALCTLGVILICS